MDSTLEKIIKWLLNPHAQTNLFSLLSKKQYKIISTMNIKQKAASFAKEEGTKFLSTFFGVFLGAGLTLYINSNESKKLSNNLHAIMYSDCLNSYQNLKHQREDIFNFLDIEIDSEEDFNSVNPILNMYLNSKDIPIDNINDGQQKDLLISNKHFISYDSYIFNESSFPSLLNDSLRNNIESYRGMDPVVYRGILEHLPNLIAYYNNIILISRRLDFLNTNFSREETSLQLFSASLDKNQRDSFNDFFQIKQINHQSMVTKDIFDYVKSSDAYADSLFSICYLLQQEQFKRNCNKSYSEPQNDQETLIESIVECDEISS